MSDFDPIKRARVMKRSIALGHCVCDVQKPCPCPLFKQENVCECAGERRTPKQSGQIRLTQHVRAAGCASKISKKMLQETLSGLPFFDDPRVLISSATSDDAGVVMLDERQSLVMTTDVFTPTVDDPYTFGQIAAANSISDIYAMGAKPLAALSIIGFPAYEFPPEVMFEILKGGIEKLKEAGIAVVGGHSINDQEIKCGFAVVGTVPTDSVLRNYGAKVGDKVVLTKALGTGVIAFAQQLERATPAMQRAAIASMIHLNKNGAESCENLRVHAMTDVTGFSLMGHMIECAKQTNIKIEIDFDALPLLEGVKTLAQQDVFSGAVERNRESIDPTMCRFINLEASQENLLFSPETSGGLLLFIDPDDVDIYMTRMREKGDFAVVIGEVTGEGRPLIEICSRCQYLWTKQPLTSIEEKENDMEKTKEPAPCCANPPSEHIQGDRPNPAHNAIFANYLGATMGSAGAIDLMHKKLMAIALSVGFKCQPCIDINIAAAKEAGASDAQVAEAVEMGIAFGGASALMSYKNG